MRVDNDVPNWFPTLNNFYRSPFSKWTPQYRTNSTLSDFNEISYLSRLWCPELIPDIEQFLPIVIFKMAATIPHNFNIVRRNTSQIQHCSISTKFHMLLDYGVRNWFPTLQNFYRSRFSKWPPQYRKKIKLRICHNAKCSFKLLSVAGLGDFIIVRL